MFTVRVAGRRLPGSEIRRWRSAGRPTHFLYDGDTLVAEFDASNTLLARYVHGPAAGADDPIVEYNGNSSAASARTNLYADARGSIVLRTGHSDAPSCWRRHEAEFFLLADHPTNFKAESSNRSSRFP